MFNHKLIDGVLRQIEESIAVVQDRFAGIHSIDDFLNSKFGLMTLDSICMKLIAIGESVKNLDQHTGGKLLAKYPDIDWKGVKGVRDIISHHYFNLDAEEIFNICRIHLPALHTTIQQMIADLKKQ